MLVVLRRQWFAPNNVLYSPDRKGVEVPDAFLKKLPPDAKVLSAKPVDLPPEPKPVPATLRDFDEVRAAGEAEDKANAAVEQALEAVRSKNAARARPAK